ncbi:MAG: hypothetical protein ACI85O_000065 [Saprospiraceae bacterium]|jgi:hypothetical protein
MSSYDYDYPGNSNLYGAPGTMTPSNPLHPHNDVNHLLVIAMGVMVLYPTILTGTGNVMFVDPDSRTGTAYWKQVVNIHANTDYVFSDFIYVRDSPEAEFYFKIGLEQLNEKRQYVLGEWREAYALWNSGSNSGGR